MKTSKPVWLEGVVCGNGSIASGKPFWLEDLCFGGAIAD